MTFRFHAAPPAGEWINDPNGLVFSGGCYRLFVQHSAAADAAIGWARLSSADLLGWRWDGQVILPDAGGYAYSGSVWPDGGAGLEAFLTRHAPHPDGPVQSQHRARSADAGASWTMAPEPFGPSGRNVRDPFVFAGPGGGRGALVARPCDWTDWRADPPSSVEVLAERDGGWAAVGRIDLAPPPGLMWEVPVLLRFGRRWVLMVSTVDRRADRADCDVRYWPGLFDGAAFAPDPGWPGEGRPLDLGPDFYAAIPSAEGGWPGEGRTVVAWASSWATARTMDWGGIRGGPISLPRLVALDVAGRLRQRPWPAAEPLAATRCGLPAQSFEIVVAGRDAELRILGDHRSGDVTVTRTAGDERLNWRRHHAGLLGGADDRGLSLFVDGPLIELFIQPDGLSITAALPGAGTPVVRVTAVP